MTEILYGIDRNQIIRCTDERTLKEITDLMVRGCWHYPMEFRSPRIRSWHGCILVDDKTGPGSFYEDFGPDRTLIMEYIVQGKTLPQMSVLMHMSIRGIRYHIEKMKTDLNVSSREELLARFLMY